MIHSLFFLGKPHAIVVSNPERQNLISISHIPVTKKKALTQKQDSVHEQLAAPQVSSFSPETSDFIEAHALGKIDPPYPDMSIRLQEEGTAVVLVNISEQGAVTHASILVSSGWTRLDQSALETVKNSRFFPAQIQGRPIASSKKITISFQLNS